MINSNMRNYDYFLLGVDNGYGQLTMTPEKQGEVNIGITILTKTVTDDLRYADAEYLGLTFDKNITDSYIIKYGEKLLKVKYIIPTGRHTQVFMSDYE